MPERRGGRRQTFVPQDNVQVVEELPDSGREGIIYIRNTDGATFQFFNGEYEQIGQEADEETISLNENGELEILQGTKVIYGDFQDNLGGWNEEITNGNDLTITNDDVGFVNDDEDWTSEDFATPGFYIEDDEIESEEYREYSILRTINIDDVDFLSLYGMIRRSYALNTESDQEVYFEIDEDKYTVLDSEIYDDQSGENYTWARSVQNIDVSNKTGNIKVKFTWKGTMSGDGFDARVRLNLSACIGESEEYPVKFDLFNEEIDNDSGGTNIV